MGLFDVIGGVANLAGSVVSGLFSSKNQKSANSTNIQLQQNANQANIDLWREQSNYNSPVEQMKRLTEAGLNPQLAYGNLNQSFASPAPTLQSASVAPIPSPDFGQMMRDFTTYRQNLKLAKAQERKTQNEADNEEIKSLLYDAQALHSRALGANEQWVYQQRSRLRETYDEIVTEQLNQIKQTNALNYVTQVLTTKKQELLAKEISIADENLTQQQARAKLWKIGINPDAGGMDRLINMLITNPQQLRTIIEQIRQTGYGIIGDVVKQSLTPSQNHLNQIYLSTKN